MFTTFNSRNNKVILRIGIITIIAVALLSQHGPDFNVDFVMPWFPSYGMECTPPCPIPELHSPKQFKQYFTEKEYLCNNFTYFGEGDGSKGVCLDPPFQMTPGNCHVLSFGIKKDWSFDESSGHFGCKVYSFDPTIGKTDFEREPNIQFFNLGLSNRRGKKKLAGKECKVDRFVNILETVRLVNKTLAYVKIDIESSEIEFFQDIFRSTPYLLKYIKQIGMELHYGNAGDSLVTRMHWQYMHELKCHGFKLMDSRQYGTRSEVVWGRPY